jgi:hypothetical protein
MRRIIESIKEWLEWAFVLFIVLPIAIILLTALKKELYGDD